MNTREIVTWISDGGVEKDRKWKQGNKRKRGRGGE